MNPQKTGLAVNVGVTGHRNISSKEQQCLEKLVYNVLEFIAAVCEEIHSEIKDFYNNSEPKLRLITCLADGFDRIAAQVSLDLGYEIQCPLPFQKDEYCKDFSSENSKAQFYYLLHRATAIYELNFGRDISDKHYLNAGTVLLEQTDILLAFWDGLHSKGPGGTGDIVELAKENGIPVINISRNMEITFERKEAWKEKVKSAMRDILIPCSNISDKNSFPYLYFNERLEQKDNAWIYNYVIKLFSAKLKKINISEEVLENHGNGGSKINIAERKYFDNFFREADELAVYYADYYRSAGILRMLIPLFANIALAVGFYWRWGDNPNIINVIGFLTQAILLYWMVSLVGKRNEKNKWHQKFIDYRILAESIKYQSFAMSFGITLREIEISAYNENDNISWINWYLRNIVREIGLPNMIIDKESIGQSLDVFKYELILDQIEYHSRSAVKMSSVGKRLERIGILFFTAGALVTVIRVFVHYGCQIYPDLTWLPNPNIKIIKLPTFMNMLSLLLPAFGTVIFAIGTQEGFDKLAQRHSYMREQLTDVYEHINEIKDEYFLKTRRLIFNVVTLMMDEVADWRMFIKSKGISKR